MLETVFLGFYGLFLIYYLRINLDASRSFNLLINSKTNKLPIFYFILFLKKILLNRNIKTQSAENCKGFSETIRQLSNSFSNYRSEKDPQIDKRNKNKSFFHWLAGIIDGNGNFDIRKDSLKKPVLKAIRIRLHNRDIRILIRIQNFFHMGRIRQDKHKQHSMFIISRKEEMFKLLNSINGLIRVKADSFKKVCDLYNIHYIEPNYNIQPYDPYFSGLIDTNGSIVFNFTSNRIECNLEFKYNNNTSKFNFDNVIPNVKPYILLRKHFNKDKVKEYKSIAFKYQTVKSMIPIYDYFMVNRLYSDFKFYRVSQIKKFIEIRDFKFFEFDSVEYQIYSNFLLNWIQYKNPLWTKVPFIKKIRIR